MRNVLVSLFVLAACNSAPRSATPSPTPAVLPDAAPPALAKDDAKAMSDLRVDFTTMADDACACPDMTCVDAVSKRMTELSAKLAALPTGSLTALEALEKQGMRATDCMLKLAKGASARPVPAIMSAATRGTAKACAFVTFSYDSRALPTTTTQARYDDFVAAQADHVRAKVPRGAKARILVDRGSIHALFDADSLPVALGVCQRTVDAYLPTAPMLPLISAGTATSATECASCD